MSSFLRPFKLLILFGLLPASSVFSAAAQSTPGAFTGAAFTSTIAELRAAAAAAPPQAEFSAQILLDEATYRLAENGTLYYSHHLIFRVDDKASLNDWSEASMDWDPWYEKPAELHARVLQPDGRFVELDQKTITDAPVKSDDVDTYSSEHERRAPLPGVVVGSIVEEFDVVEEKSPYFSDGGIYRYNFLDSVPSAIVRLVVDLPATMPFQEAIHFLPNLSIQRAETAGRRHIVYEKTTVPARHNSDIDLNTDNPQTPAVEFATGASWKAVASGYAKLSDPQTITDEARTILPKDLPTDRLQKINAIVARLHREVRYTGVEFGSAKLTPQRPAEVIKRHYGDCKDKANLLVAMLRAADIPANLALLSTGPGLDVAENMPGMNEFNHAIVYVPAQGAAPALWIDATAEYDAPGSLPYMDKGRLALVISPETTSLTRIPAATSQDSRLVETRTFTLSPLGSAKVTEVSETSGAVDANYRSMYGGTDTKKIRESLESYTRGYNYAAKSLVSIHHGNTEDLTQPFRMTLEIDGAKRGTTVMDEAEVAIVMSIETDSLPDWLQKAPAVIGPDTTAEQKHEMELSAANRKASYVYRPYQEDRLFRILIPDGFVLRALPPNKTTKLGAATLIEEYAAPEKGVVTALYKFDSGPGTLTADEALAMRADVLEFNKRDYVGIFFDQVGAKELAAGHIRAALDADRAQIAAHPKDALPHVRLARALLTAGIGNQARSEAKLATELDPKSSAAFNALGWVLQHDNLGTRFGPDYDLAGSIAAYKKAIALDPDNNDIRFDLGVLYEHNAQGTRYAKGADLDAAAKLYRELIERTKDNDASSAAQYRENLLYVLYFNRNFAELDKLLASVPSSNLHSSFAIASAAAQHGAAAGIAQADQRNIEASDRNKNLSTAGSLLIELQKYSESAAIMQASIGAGTDSATTARQIELYKNLKPASLEPLPPTNPAQPVQQNLVSLMAGTMTAKVAEAEASRHAYTSEAIMHMDIDKGMDQVSMMRAIATKSGLSEVVLLDLVVGSTKFSSTGDDASGYSVVSEGLGSEPSHVFVVREDGAFHIVGDASDDRQLANETLYALAHGNPKLAKSMLDWKRDLTHKSGGDDPFGGPLLPRFWTVGSSKEGADSPEAMHLAALSLLAGTMDAKPYLAELVELQKKATGARQTELDLLLAKSAVGAEQPDTALPAAKRLLEQEPDSLEALVLLGQSYSQQKDTANWLATLAPRLAKKPKDHDLLSQQSRAYELAGDFASARKSKQGVLDSGKATASDYNSFAWIGLFDNHLGDDEIKAAQQSNMLSKNASFNDMHTLAAIYAAMGRTTEATQVLTQAMSAANMSKPNSAIWYVLGLIYEQYGATDAALAAYRAVQAHEFDDHTYIDPTSTYVLAQTRIAALEKK